MPKAKQEVITFKADEELSRALKAVPNRSEFIRSAVLAALENVCPVCQGVGFLTPEQRRHWEVFSQDHRVHKCDDCKAYYIICECNGIHELSHQKTGGTE